MATACYPRNYSFVAVNNNEESEKETKPEKPHVHRVQCRYCRYILPYLATQLESQVMVRIRDVTGEQAVTHYYCPSNQELGASMHKLFSHPKMSEQRMERLDRTLGDFSAYESCLIKMERAIKARREADRLEAARQKYARHHKVIAEEDYPQYLQKERVSPQENRASPQKKTVMGRDHRIQAPRRVVQDYEYNSDSSE